MLANGVQAMDEGFLDLLPSTSATITVCFYADDPQELAEKHDIVKALLTVVPKPRQGSYHAPMAALCNLLNWPPFRIVKALQVRSLPWPSAADAIAEDFQSLGERIFMDANVVKESRPQDQCVCQNRLHLSRRSLESNRLSSGKSFKIDFLRSMSNLPSKTKLLPRYLKLAIHLLAD